MCEGILLNLHLLTRISCTFKGIKTLIILRLPDAFNHMSAVAKCYFIVKQRLFDSCNNNLLNLYFARLSMAFEGSL